jgi:PAS domain S-box-containing protein
MSRVASESTQALVICEAAGPARVISHANPAFTQLTGYSRADAVGRSLPELLRPPGGQFEWERVDTVMRGTLPRNPRCVTATRVFGPFS